MWQSDINIHAVLEMKISIYLSESISWICLYIEIKTEKFGQTKEHKIGCFSANCKHVQNVALSCIKEWERGFGSKSE